VKERSARSIRKPLAVLGIGSLSVAAVAVGSLAPVSAGSTQAAKPAFLFWATGGPNGGGNSIARANLDGSHVNTNFIAWAVPEAVATSSTPNSVAVDGNYLYWSQARSSVSYVGRANLNGTDVNLSLLRIPPVLPSVIATPQGIAVTNAYIYWANATGSGIGRANLNGTDVNQQFIKTTGDTGAVAVNANHLYWTSFKQLGSATTIGRANLNGTDVNQQFITGTSNASGIAISGPYIYWTNYGPTAAYATSSSVPRTTIGRANLNGTGVNENFITGTHAGCGLVIAAGRIYWANDVPIGNGTIGSANLDGTDANENFIPGAGAPCGLAVAP
jgi:hypothetical protein